MKRLNFILLSTLVLLLTLNSSKSAAQTSPDSSWYPLEVGNEWHYFYGAWDAGIGSGYCRKVVDSLQINNKVYYKIDTHVYDVPIGFGFPPHNEFPSYLDTLTVFERYDEEFRSIWAYDSVIYNSEILVNYYGDSSYWQNYNKNEVLLDTLITVDTTLNYAGRYFANTSNNSIESPTKKYRIYIDNIDDLIIINISNEFIFNKNFVWNRTSYEKGIGLINADGFYMNSVS